MARQHLVYGAAEAALEVATTAARLASGRWKHESNEHAQSRHLFHHVLWILPPRRGAPPPRGIAFESIDVTGDVHARAELVARAGGRRTVPVIFVDGKAIGGYQELAALLRAGELKHISAAA